MLLHKFLNTSGEFWSNGFSTCDAILHTPYSPKVLFIGTFNHGWEWNTADFFYGRGMYMWPILYNVFQAKRNKLISPRTSKVRTPSLDEMFSLCFKSKLSFADLVKGTTVDVTTEVNLYEKKVIVNDKFEWDNYSDKQLNQLGKNGFLENNVDAIAAHINNTSSIDFVYFTFKINNSWLSSLATRLKNSIHRQINIGSIFTPTGNGFRDVLSNYPTKVASITHLWIWVNEPLSHLNPNPVQRQGYIHIDHNWLLENNVPLENF